MSKKNRTYGSDPRPPAGLQVTQPTQWRRSPDQGELLELPSGNVVRARRPGMPTFLELGMVPNSLIPIVDTSINLKKPPKMDEIVEDDEKVIDTVKFMDSVFIYSVLEPRVNPLPEPDDEGVVQRKVGELYIDDIDPEDKVFLFQYAVGGTRSVQRFREQRAADMEALAAESVAGL